MPLLPFWAFVACSVVNFTFYLPLCICRTRNWTVFKWVSEKRVTGILSMNLQMGSSSRNCCGYSVWKRSTLDIFGLPDQRRFVNLLDAGSVPYGHQPHDPIAYHHSDWTEGWISAITGLGVLVGRKIAYHCREYYLLTPSWETNWFCS
jgi:hypothetical protein